MSEVSMADSAKTSIPFREVTRQTLKRLGAKQETLRSNLLTSFRAATPHIPKEVFHFEPLESHPGMEEITFHHPDYDVPLHAYYRRAENEQEVDASCTGLKETISTTHSRIEELNDQGTSYLSFRLPNVGQHPHIVPFYMELMEYYFLNEQSPVHQLFPGTRKVAHGHSTSGAGLTVLNTTHRTAADMAETYAWIFGDSPFYDSPNASLLDPFWRQQLPFTLYAMACGNSIPEKTWAGNFYLIFKDIEAGKIKIENSAGNIWTDTFHETNRRFEIIRNGGQPYVDTIPPEAQGLDAEYRLPTYAQMLELRNYMRHHFRNVDKQGLPEHRAPMTIYSDIRDGYSSGSTSIVAAAKFGMDFVKASGYHNQFNDDDFAFNHFKSKIVSLRPQQAVPVEQPVLVAVA